MSHRGTVPPAATYWKTDPGPGEPSSTPLDTQQPPPLQPYEYHARPGPPGMMQQQSSAPFLVSLQQPRTSSSPLLHFHQQQLAAAEQQEQAHHYYHPQGHHGGGGGGPPVGEPLGKAWGATSLAGLPRLPSPPVGDVSAVADAPSRTGVSRHQGPPPGLGHLHAPVALGGHDQQHLPFELQLSASAGTGQSPPPPPATSPTQTQQLQFQHHLLEHRLHGHLQHPSPPPPPQQQQQQQQQPPGGPPVTVVLERLVSVGPPRTQEHGALAQQYTCSAPFLCLTCDAPTFEGVLAVVHGFAASHQVVEGRVLCMACADQYAAREGRPLPSQAAGRRMLLNQAIDEWKKHHYFQQQPMALPAPQVVPHARPPAAREVREPLREVHRSSRSGQQQLLWGDVFVADRDARAYGRAAASGLALGLPGRQREPSAVADSAAHWTGLSISPPLRASPDTVFDTDMGLFDEAVLRDLSVSHPAVGTPSLVAGFSLDLDDGAHSGSSAARGGSFKSAADTSVSSASSAEDSCADGPETSAALVAQSTYRALAPREKSPPGPIAPRGQPAAAPDPAVDRPPRPAARFGGPAPATPSAPPPPERDGRTRDLGRDRDREGGVGPLRPRHATVPDSSLFTARTRLETDATELSLEVARGGGDSSGGGQAQEPHSKKNANSAWVERIPLRYFSSKQIKDPQLGKGFLVVEQIVKNSAAWRAHLRPGDVVVRFGRLDQDEMHLHDLKLHAVAQEIKAAATHGDGRLRVTWLRRALGQQRGPAAPAATDRDGVSYRLMTVELKVDRCALAGEERSVPVVGLVVQSWPPRTKDGQSWPVEQPRTWEAGDSSPAEDAVARDRSVARSSGGQHQALPEVVAALPILIARSSASSSSRGGAISNGRARHKGPGKAHK